MSESTTFFNVLFSRRSIRRYLPREVPGEVIERLLSAAIWAPSAHNRQPWRFALVQRPSLKEELARAMGERLRADLQVDGLPPAAIEKDVARSYARIRGAPLLIMVCMSMMDMDRYPDERRQDNEWLMAVQSTAMAGQNLLLAAQAEGLGACWMCAPLFCPNVVKHTLALPADWQPQGLVTCGYPAETREKERAPLGTRVLYDDPGHRRRLE